MNKNSYKYTQFLKLINDNTRFMEKLDRQKPEKIKKPGVMIPVPMNILSSNEHIFSIKKIKELMSLPKELIENKKFRFKIEYCDEHGTKDTVHIDCPFTKETLESQEREENIKSIKIEFWLKYDNASEDAQKKYDKNNKQ